MRSKCADRLSLAKHNRLSFKHFVVAPYSSHDLFYTRDSQMLYLQSIPDLEEDQPAVVSSSELLSSVCRSCWIFFQVDVVHLPSRVLLLLAFRRSVHRKFLLLPMVHGSWCALIKFTSALYWLSFVESFILFYHHFHSHSSSLFSHFSSSDTKSLFS